MYVDSRNGMILELTDIEKSFDNKPVLRGVSVSLAAGEIVVLLGPSGCGKTTLLRIIAGLETADNGRLHLNNQDLTTIPVHKRGFGFVFQDYALFPHKNVFENVAFGLRMHKWSSEKVRERVQQVLELVGLTGFEDRQIHELSGGEQQRIALARSLAPAPRLILLDEPLGALDRALREHLMLELRQILKHAGGMIGRPEGITAVYVTHDQAEAFAIADRVLVMNAGRVEQVGAPADLYRSPATPFVARFLGMGNIVSGAWHPEQPHVVQAAIGLLYVNSDSETFPAPFSVLIRPEAAQLHAIGNDEQLNQINGRFTDVSFRGRYQIATFVIEGETAVSLKFEFDTTEKLPKVGVNGRLFLHPDSIVLLEGG
ncbi:MAG: ABC transporter ATP-binding protein [Chloroflexi bacterium]|nr:ABC transporter ATP-binding protein [Chloroflexota bacterium]